MDAERLKQIEEIFHAALEIAPAGRETFFKQRCGDDEELRREVESLLAVNRTSNNLFVTPLESLAARNVCQTRQRVRGEGLIGLTRGFMYAGARRVVVSLWSVNDKAAADLMEKLYRG